MNIRELLAEGGIALIEQDVGRLEAEILLGEVLGVNRAWFYANPDTEVEPRQARRYRELIARRECGEPIAYLTKNREFWSLPLKVTKEVLIPRPETELLIETTLGFIPQGAAWRIADLGTGSGAIALALAMERPDCEIHATEVSEAALEVARENGQAIAPGRVQFHPGSWLTPLQGTFRLLVSNPPYIASDDPHLKQGDCRFEPIDALSPGDDALAAIRHIAGESRHYLEKGGILVLEHGYDQGPAVRLIMNEFAYRKTGTVKDLEKRERVTWGVRE